MNCLQALWKLGSPGSDEHWIRIFENLDHVDPRIHRQPQVIFDLHGFKYPCSAVIQLWCQTFYLNSKEI